MQYCSILVEAICLRTISVLSFVHVDKSSVCHSFVWDETRRQDWHTRDRLTINGNEPYWPTALSKIFNNTKSGALPQQVCFTGSTNFALFVAVGAGCRFVRRCLSTTVVWLRERFRSNPESSLSLVPFCFDLRWRFRGDLDVLGAAAWIDVTAGAVARFFLGVRVAALASTVFIAVPMAFFSRILIPTTLSLNWLWYMATSAFFLPALGFLLAAAFAAVAFAIFSATIANALGLPPDTSFFFLFFGDVDDGDDDDGSAKQKLPIKIVQPIFLSTIMHEIN